MRDEATEIMGYLARTYFDNHCFVTKEKFRDRGYVIHHLWYKIKDITRGEYPKGEVGRQSYIKALKPEVEKKLTREEKLDYYKRLEALKYEFDELFKEMINNEPMRFMLLKNGIHTRIDHVRNGLSRMKRENQMRLFIAVLMTVKTRRKK